MVSARRVRATGDAGSRHGPVGRLSTLLVLVVAALLAGPTALLAQDSAPELVIRDASVDADGVVTVLVAVSADVSEQEALEGLRVFEDGVLVEDVEAAFVPREDAPTAAPSAEVALLLDTSGSTADNDALAAAQAAANAFVASLAEQGVPVTLVAFASSPSVLVTRSTDVAALQAAIAGLSPGGETALYDAVDVAVDILGASAAEQRELVVFTDGGDTASPDEGEEPAAVLAATAQRAADAELPITLVSLETTETDAAALATLASTTQGLVLPVAESAQLAGVLEDVARSIATQLRITYPTPRPTAAVLNVVVSLALDRGVFTTAPRRATNPLGSIPGAAVPDQGDPPRVAAPEPLLFQGRVARSVGLGAGAIAVVLVGFVLFSTPAERRSARVLQRQVGGKAEQRRARAAADEQHQLRDRVTALIESVPRPSGYDERIQAQLERAAWPLRTSEYVGLRVAAALAGFVFGWGLLLAGANDGANLVFPALLTPLGWMAPWFVLQRRQQRRNQAFHEQMADTMQMLAGSLRAGYGLMQGIDNVATEGQAPTSTEFGRVLTEVRLGVPIEDALAAMAERVGSEDFRWVTVAITIQRKVGGNLAELLDTVARTLREREAVRRQVRVLSAEGRLSAWVLIALPVFFALYLTITQPDYLAPLFSSLIGWLLVLTAFVLMGIGIVWIRRVVRIDV